MSNFDSIILTGAGGVGYRLLGRTPMSSQTAILFGAYSVLGVIGLLVRVPDDSNIAIAIESFVIIPLVSSAIDIFRVVAKSWSNG